MQLRQPNCKRQSLPMYEVFRIMSTKFFVLQTRFHGKECTRRIQLSRINYCQEQGNLVRWIGQTTD